MKHIKFFESFFNHDRKGYGDFYWYDGPSNYRYGGDEVEKLESIGCFRKIANSPAPFYYIPKFSETIQLITIQKIVKHPYPVEDCFYKITIDLIGGKKSKRKYFDTFEEMFEALKLYIPEIDRNTKKYNL